jgi:hypothetical protein
MGFLCQQMLATIAGIRNCGLTRLREVVSASNGKWIAIALRAGWQPKRLSWLRNSQRAGIPASVNW